MLHLVYVIETCCTTLHRPLRITLGILGSRFEVQSLALTMAITAIVFLVMVLYTLQSREINFKWLVRFPLSFPSALHSAG